MSGIKALVFSSLLLLLAIGVRGQDNWDLALAQYRSGNYDASIALWDSIAVEEPSAAVFFNLGNAWYEKGDIPRSVLYYEKALLLDPGHRNTRENLEIARSYIEDPVPVIRSFFLARWWKAFTDILSPNGWAFLFLLAFSLFVAIWILYLFGKITKRIRNIGMLVFLLLTLASGFSARSTFRHVIDHNRAVVLPRSVTLYTSPDEMSPVLREFPGGTVVRIIDRLDDWLLVVLPNMEQGWVEASTLERI